MRDGSFIWDDDELFQIGEWALTAKLNQGNGELKLVRLYFHRNVDETSARRLPNQMTRESNRLRTKTKGNQKPEDNQRTGVWFPQCCDFFRWWRWHNDDVMVMKVMRVYGYGKMKMTTKKKMRWEWKMMMRMKRSMTCDWLTEYQNEIPFIPPPPSISCVNKEIYSPWRVEIFFPSWGLLRGLGTSLWELKGVAVDNCGRCRIQERVDNTKQVQQVDSQKRSNNNFLSVDETTFTCQTFSHTRNQLSDNR